MELLGNPNELEKLNILSFTHWMPLWPQFQGNWNYNPMYAVWPSNNIEEVYRKKHLKKDVHSNYLYFGFIWEFQIAIVALIIYNGVHFLLDLFRN